MTFISSWIFFGLRASILPVFVTEELKSTTAIVGYGLALSAIIQGVFLLRAGRFSDAKGRKASAVLGSNIILPGVILFAQFPTQP